MKQGIKEALFLSFKVFGVASVLLALTLNAAGLLAMADFQSCYGKDCDLYFDGPVPFMLGAISLILFQLFRFPFYRPAMVVAGAIGVAVLCWLRLTLPTATGHEVIFPSAGLLHSFIAASSALLVLGLADELVRRFIDSVVVSPCCRALSRIMPGRG